MYFQKYQGTDNQWYWRLRAGNNETVASGEGYATENGVDRAITMLQKFGQDLSDATVKSVPATSPKLAKRKSGRVIYLLEIVKELAGRKTKTRKTR